MRFNFSIVDDDGEIVVSDWTTFGMADFRDTGVETIEIHIYSALRAIKRDQERARWKAELEAAEDAR